MKKIILIMFLTAAISLIAQNKKTDVDSSASIVSPIEILTKIELKSQLGATPIFSDNRIYATEKSGTLSCYDSIGHMKWKRQTSSEIISRPIVADGQLAAASANSDIITLIELTGEQIQSIGIDDSISTNLVALDYEGDKELFLPKQSSSKTAIIFGTRSGTIFCLDLETLQEYWRNNNSQGLLSSQLAVVENKILFTGSDGYMYSIDARNGLLNWRWKETAETDFSNAHIVCDIKKVFLVSKDSQLYNVDLLLGKLIWKADYVKVLPAVGISKNRKELFVKTSDKRFLIISADKGTVLKQVKREDEFDLTLIPPFDDDGKIYFTNKNSIFTLDKNLKEEMIYNLSDEAIYSFQLIGDNKFLVSTTTGTILIFRPRK